MIEFARWYRLAQHCFWLEFPDAICLATVDANGTPDSRMILLKDFDQRGFVFFTNYNSKKGKQLIDSKQASLTFFWDTLQRQIRVQGLVEKTSDVESDQYFKSRSRESQLGAWASQQSEVLSDRAELEARYFEFFNKFKDVAISRPENWGGFRLIPQKIEFWKARPHRLHDRFLYIKDGQGLWKLSSLFP